MSVREHDEQITTELQTLRKSIEKVKVSREVAEAIEYLLNHEDYGYTKEKLLVAHAGMEKYPKRNWAGDNPLNDIDLLVLAAILVNGYDIEQTPEEKLAEFYRGRVNSSNDYEREYAHGIEFAVRSLGIKIKGVNE